ncbi:hypothetical protein ACWD4J_43740 [Streptomyces sp. NPDC002577]
MKQIKGAAAVQDVAIPSLGQVSDQGPLTDSDRGIYGVTGPLCLDNKGNPYNKAVAIVTLDPDDKGVRFEALAWPTGKPSTSCVVPQTGTTGQEQ